MIALHALRNEELTTLAKGEVEHLPKNLKPLVTELIRRIDRVPGSDHYNSTMRMPPGENYYEPVRA